MLVGIKLKYYSALFLTLTSCVPLQCIFILNITFFRTPEITVMGKKVTADPWVHVVSWLLVFSSLVTIPIFAVVKFVSIKGTFKEVTDWPVDVTFST